MKANHRLILGIVVLVIFGAMAFVNLNKTIAPYVSFSEAMAAGGAVQVAGFPDHAAARFEPETGLFHFTLSDDGGELLPVTYDGARPGNFDQAESIVAVGRYEGGAFRASQLLVKCPSKYQSEGEYHPGNEPGENKEPDTAPESGD